MPAPTPVKQNSNAHDMSKVFPRTVIQYDVHDILSELAKTRARDAQLAASGFSLNQPPSHQSRSLSLSRNSSSNPNRNSRLFNHARRRSTYAPVAELPLEEEEGGRAESLRNSSLVDLEAHNEDNGAIQAFNANTIESNMSRASRPTHIPLPTSPYNGRSPTGSPLPTASGNPGSPTSPRSSFLPSFMRTRSRAATLTGNRGRNSPSTEASNPLGSPIIGSSANNTNNTAQHTANRSQTSSDLSAVREGAAVTRSISTPHNSTAPFTPGTVATASTWMHSGPVALPPPTLPAPTETSNPLISSSPSKTFRIRLVPHLESTRSLAFDPVIRELHPISVPPGVSPGTVAAGVTGLPLAVNGRPPALLLRLGRFTDKSTQLPIPTDTANTATAIGTGGAGSAAAGPSTGGNGSGAAGPTPNTLTIAGGGGDICSNKVAFKSKVVSRAHAEIWCEAGGKFFIRDTSSSSGTFLNHIRLSSPNTESRPTQINDGDVLQLGVDYQGGHEDMFRCVKMRVELGREWQRAANEFNTNALKQLKALGGATPDSKGKTTSTDTPPSIRKGKTSVTDCCICLFSVTVCQSLFIAPCSHVFHYKCIRPLLLQHHPGFSCPLCRTFANLEEDVETEDAWEIASRRVSLLSRRPSTHSVQQIPSPESMRDLTSMRDLPITGPFGQTTSANDLGFDSMGPSVDQPDSPAAQLNTDDEVPISQAGHSSDPALFASQSGSNPLPDSPLERQTTAVQGDRPPNGTTLRSIPDAVDEDDEAIGTTISNGMGPPSTYFNAREGINTTSHHFGPEETASIPINSNNPFLSSFSQAATPMNETFLSTLAPGMHQRLELAEAIDSGSSNGHGSVSSAASAAGSGSGSGSGTREVDEVNGDMMDMDLDDQRLSTGARMEASEEAEQKRSMEARRGEVEDMAFS